MFFSVSCQTAPEVSLGTVPETDIYKEVHSRTYFSKDVATNVAAYDLCPPQQGFLPPVDSLSFQVLELILKAFLLTKILQINKYY